MNKIVDRIILLRHEERGPDPSFNSSLTEKGRLNIETLMTRLEKLQFIPTSIYSSPYLRCLQTAQPISKQLNTPVKVDNSLAEWFNPKDLANYYPNTCPRELTDIEMGNYRVDPCYMSFLRTELFPDPESWKNCRERTSNFLNFLEKKYENTDDKILLISHMSVLNAICNNVGHCRHSEDMFKMGSLIKLRTLQEY